MSTATDTLGWSGLLRGPHRSTAIIIAVAVALQSTNIYVASAVMPSATAEVGGVALYAWATTVFVLAAVIGSTAMATILGRHGSRRTYRAAILLVAAGTLLCAVAPSMPVLLAGRAVQGFGGGALFALAYSLVRLVLPETLWSRAMALVSAAWGIGTFAGPAVGGSFSQIDQWRLAFWVVVPLTIAFAIWGGARLPLDAGKDPQRPAAPVRSAATLGAAVLALCVAGASSTPGPSLVGIAVAGILLVLWLRHERRTAGPRLLPTATFRRGPLRWAYVAMALLMVAATPEVFISYFGQHLQGLGPLAAGYLGTALAAGWTGASIVTGGWAERRNQLLRIAPIVSAVGIAGLVVVGPMTGGALVVTAIAVGFVLLGAGVGIAWPHLVTTVMTATPQDEQQLAGSSVTTVQLTAAAAGAAIGGVVVNLAGFSDPGGAGLESAARWLYVVILAAPVLTAVTIGRVVRRQAAVAAPTPTRRRAEPAEAGAR